MRTRNFILLALLALTFCAQADAAPRTWSITPSSTSFSVSPPNFGRFGQPRQQTRPLIPVTRRGRVGQRQVQQGNFGHINGQGSFLKAAVADSLEQNLQDQVQSFDASRVVERNRKRNQRSLRRTQGPRMHGLGANSAGYRFPLQ